ncbi:hypothetical protein F6J85_02900 [Microbacterium lushaniae]|uniref:Uncharacterized protein n=1 Tax=Microbacterium lushaniae TaxID=2614639 RepID=A0A5J6L0Z0_9MICO|nr:hypothetical protein F6J85_02900 [Microbacterium lushaniae]
MLRGWLAGGQTARSPASNRRVWRRSRRHQSRVDLRGTREECVHVAYTREAGVTAEPIATDFRVHHPPGDAVEVVASSRGRRGY